MLGQQKNTLYPLMVSSFRSSLAKTSEAHGSQAMGYLWSAVAARQIGTQHAQAEMQAIGARANLLRHAADVAA